MTPAERAVETAISLKGNTRQKCAEIYNAYLPHPRGYKVKYDSDKMCAAFISAIYIELKWTDIVPPECGARELFRNMEALDRTTEDKHHVPVPGEIIFFGLRADVIYHVGIVIKVVGKTIYYLDMNATVKQGTCKIGDKGIAGYGLPDYASKGESVPDKDDKKAFSPGDLVTINPGAKWYKGQSIPVSVVADQWHIIQCKGDRAVLGTNKAETRNIQSPIHVQDITLVNPCVIVETPEQKKVELSVKVNLDTYELLKIMADGNKKTIGEIIDLLLEDAR